MHDLDRTQNQYESYEGGPDAFESNLYEGEAGPDMSFEFEQGEAFGQYQGEYEWEAAPDEVREYELAAELLGVRDEAELDQFIGKLIRKAARAAKRALPGLGNVLRGVARKALPVVGGMAGTLIGGPLGGMAGSKLASTAGQIFGLELEGLSQEDGEFEVARRFVRFADEAARRLARTGPGPDPRQALRAAVVAAARQHAPGLLAGGLPGLGTPTGCRCGATGGGGGLRGMLGESQDEWEYEDEYESESEYEYEAGPQAQGRPASAPAGGGPRRRSGRWVRRGNKIILYGV